MRTLFLVAVLFACLPVSLIAQDTQVALDTEETVYTVDAELRDRLDLFPDVEGFQSAALYRLDDGTYELVIVYRQQGQTLRDRRTLSAEDVNALRQRVTQRLQATKTRGGFTQEGRNSLLTATTLLGVAEGGLLAAVVADDSDGSLVASLPLLGGATGFFVPLLNTRSSRVSEPAAALAGYGGLQGFAHATQLTLLALGEDGDANGRAVAALVAVGGAVEARVGYLIGNRPSWAPGMGEMVAYTGTFGNLVGLGAAAVLVGGDDVDDIDAVRAFSGLSLAGSLAGLYVGHRLARTERYTIGDARIYGNAGLLGTQLVGAVLAVSDADRLRPIATTLVGGAVGGLGVGHLLTRSRDYSKQEANIAFLATYAGGLLGSGIATVSDASTDGGFLLSSLGSAVGFGVTLGIFANSAQQRAARSASQLDIQVRPTLTSPALGQGLPGRAGSRLRPGLHMRVTF